MKKPTAVLLLSCPDRRGIVAAISNFIFTNNGNILDAAQYTARPENILFMRVEWDLEGFAVPREEMKEVFEPLARQFDMQWTIRFSDFVPRVAVFVSKHAHCFHDLILRHRMGELGVDIPLVISNHEFLRPLAEQFDLNYHRYSITPSTKTAQEKLAMKELKAERINLVILARYMQVLSPDFVKAWRNRIINIHHSFLPAFAGGGPYRQAYERGVKLIGAPSHYVTEELDEGPIIAQDVIKVSHKDSEEDMMLKGKDIERLVLAKAVRMHVENRILVYGSRTIVFE